MADTPNFVSDPLRKGSSVFKGLATHIRLSSKPENHQDFLQQAHDASESVVAASHSAALPSVEWTMQRCTAVQYRLPPSILTSPNSAAALSAPPRVYASTSPSGKMALPAIRMLSENGDWDGCLPHGMAPPIPNKLGPGCDVACLRGSLSLSMPENAVWEVTWWDG